MVETTKPPYGSPSVGKGTDGTRRGIVHRVANVVRRHPMKSIAASGLALAGVYNWKQQQREEEEDAKKKKVLVIPFYKLKLVEEREKPGYRLLQTATDRMNSSSSSRVVMEADELVGLIHKAAADPNIVALYGIFGHGFDFDSGGWAHVEEVRNALRVFRESHRVHREPNLSHEPILKRHGNGTPKPLYAYADTFSSFSGNDAMKEFYLATAFTHIQLQPQGALNLHGLHMTSFFLKDALKKYGIKVHLFKTGMKAPFLESGYTRESRENTETLLNGLNQHICRGIYHARSQLSTGFQFSKFWSMAHNAGTFSADTAQQIGFVDYLPKLDPLDQLVESNSSAEEKTKMKSKWGKSTDMDQFTAESAISISEYAKKVGKQTRKEENQWHLFQKLKTLAEANSGMRILFSTVGYQAPHFNIAESNFSEEKAKGLEEEIAVIRLNGTIGKKAARKTEKILRDLKKNKTVKCVVIRVDSPGGEITSCETIHQEIQDLPQKVVVSFGNVSASGGYYISSSADRIFASPTTITGSIGVFMARMDLRGLASQYGVKFDSVTTSELSGSYDPFYPVNNRIKENLTNDLDRAYSHFKTLVANGREMDMESVEAAAAGRVWTGEQAKELGLVDQLGGLHRAIAYAQRHYTSSGQAKVSIWEPKSLSISDTLKNVARNSALACWRLSSDFEKRPSGVGTNILRSDDFSLGGIAFPVALSGLMLTSDENAAIECLLENSDVPDFLYDFPPSA